MNFKKTCFIVVTLLLTTVVIQSCGSSETSESPADVDTMMVAPEDTPLPTGSAVDSAMEGLPDRGVDAPETDEPVPFSDQSH